mgnify:CR=1 FL=1
MAKWSSWKELPIGNILPTPGSSAEYKTGGWRALKPILHKEKCIKCLLCWAQCPEPAIDRLDDDSVKINYDYCKGCGICAAVCPVKAIEMVMEE